MRDKVEPNIIAHGQNKGPTPPGWKRPFLETPSAQRKPIAEFIERTVEFPEKDESTGELLIYYMGPRNEDLIEFKARISVPCCTFTYNGRRQLKLWAYILRLLLLHPSIKSS